MQRLDKFLVEQGFFPSREKAQDAIIQKTVKVNGNIVDKPSKQVDENTVVEMVDVFNRYVSRGGLKLEKAIRDFGLDFSGKQVLDIGASTGGFTDCALQHGASFCFCVDVGSTQLHPSLHDHPNVVFLEQKDFRDLTTEEVGYRLFDFIVADVSFISLTSLFPFFRTFLKDDGKMMLLIKPQFEAGHSFLNKNGIVVDEKGYKAAIQRIEKEALHHGFYLNNLGLSTLFELQKNIEFITVFSLKKNFYTLDFKELFAKIKETKKKLKT